VSKVIETALDAIRPLADAKEIEFTNAAPSTNIAVLGDPNRLQQIFWNLFSNAVKFTARGGRVSIETTAYDSRVSVSVADTGIGIKPEFVPFIFDRFRQADGSTTREHGGLGLGLAIVQHLVDLHAGSVEVTSDGPNRGSTFTVTIPLALDNVLVENETTAYETTGNGVFNAHLLEGVKVLIVDDEPDSRDLLMTILTSCGSDVRCSDSAAMAMLEFNEWNPDLLVSDIGMPIEDGYSLIRRIRKLASHHARIPAVALTAYATDEDRSQALLAGFQMHVPKPIEPESFVTSIASVLGRK
ncbi:MAG: ATP-binding protein, partial [Pyrinomonadaceae bacterium]